MKRLGRPAKLKPCPLCGSDRLKVYWPNDLICVIQCGKCKVEGTPCTSSRGATRMWNRRANSAAHSNEVLSERNSALIALRKYSEALKIAMDAAKFEMHPDDYKSQVSDPISALVGVATDPTSLPRTSGAGDAD